MAEKLKLEVKEVSIAYLDGDVPESIINELLEMNATMYNDDGGGQYTIENVRDRFDEQSDEYFALQTLIDDGYDYLEYS